MTLLEQLRAMVSTMPPGSSVSLPVDWLRGQLVENGAAPSPDSIPEDLTLEEFAKSVKRAPSTVRGWLNSELLPGAYKLRGRDWRIPPAVATEFLRGQAERDSGSPMHASRTTASLSDWRKFASSASVRQSAAGEGRAHRGGGV